MLNSGSQPCCQTKLRLFFWNTHKLGGGQQGTEHPADLQPLSWKQNPSPGMSSLTEGGEDLQQQLPVWMEEVWKLLGASQELWSRGWL